MKVILICGIDTDVGKTHITGHILEQLLRADLKVASYKPIQTGCNGFSSDLKTQEDLARELLVSKGLEAQLHNYLGNCHQSSYIFKNPVSPHLASEQENVHVSIDRILEDFTTYACKNYEFHTKKLGSLGYKPSYQKLDCLLVELAGGIMSPVNHLLNNLDLINLFKAKCQELNIKFEVVLVTTGKLGALSHTLSCIKLLPQVDYLVFNNYQAKLIHQNIQDLRNQVKKRNKTNLGREKALLNQAQDFTKQLSEHQTNLTICADNYNYLVRLQNYLKFEQDYLQKLCQGQELKVDPVNGVLPDQQQAFKDMFLVESAHLASIRNSALLTCKIIRFHDNFNQDYFL